MTNALLLVIIVELGYLIWSVKQITLPESKDESAMTEPFITRTAPEFVNENMAGKTEESVIVTPKSPQLLAWEEQEELRKMNLRQL